MDVILRISILVILLFLSGCQDNTDNSFLDDDIFDSDGKSKQEKLNEFLRERENFENPFKDKFNANRDND